MTEDKKHIKEDPVDLVVLPYSYDPITQLFTLKVQSPGDVEELYLLSMIHNAKWRRIKFNRIYDTALKLYVQLQKWFAKLTAIIKHDNPGIKVTKEMLYAFHYQMKLRIFEADVIRINIGGAETIMPPAMGDMTIGQVAQGIEKLCDTYDFVD